MLTQTDATLEGPLTITQTRYGDDVVVFTLSGEFDLAVARRAHTMLEPIREADCALTVLDLTELEFIDSSGVAFLYAAARAHPRKDSLRLLPSRHGGVNRVLALTEIGELIPIVTANPAAGSV